LGKFAASLNVKKSKMSQLALTLLTRGLYPWTLLGAVYMGLTVAFGGLQLSSAGTD